MTVEVSGVVGVDTNDDNRFHRILFGGDQLTVARIKEAIITHKTERWTDLKGCIVAVVEDWHVRMTLMKVNTSVCTYSTMTMLIIFIDNLGSTLQNYISRRKGDYVLTSQPHWKD